MYGHAVETNREIGSINIYNDRKVLKLNVNNVSTINSKPLQIRKKYKSVENDRKKTTEILQIYIKTGTKKRFD